MQLKFISVLTVLLLQCSTSTYVSTFQQLGNYSFPYAINEADNSYELDKILRELSGLSMTPDGILYGIQDELGHVFQLDPLSGDILNEKAFWDKGDYEGIEYTPQGLFVVKSNGHLYHIQDISAKELLIKKYNTPLKGINNVEGLEYDAKNNRLLLACKAAAGIDTFINNQRAIYAFSLDSMQLSTSPAFTINLDQIHDFLDTHPNLRKFEKVMSYFSPETENFAFNPSGLAIHPLSGDIYVLSAKKPLIVVLSPQGEILHIEKLSKKVHPQAEGICFDTKGTMYIANEGDPGERGMLHVFGMKQ